MLMLVKISSLKLTCDTSGFLAESSSVGLKGFCKIFVLNKTRTIKTNTGLNRFQMNLENCFEWASGVDSWLYSAFIGDLKKTHSGA